MNLKQGRGVKREILEAEGEGEVRSRTASSIRRDTVKRDARRKIALGVFGDARTCKRRQDGSITDGGRETKFCTLPLADRHTQIEENG